MENGWVTCVAGTHDFMFCSMATQTRFAQSYITQLRDRIQALQKRLASKDIDALLLTNPVDIRYLTGFVGEDSMALVPINGKGKKPWILSDFRFVEHIPREAPEAQVKIRKNSLPQALNELAEQHDWSRIGLQQSYVTLAQQKQFKKKAKFCKFTAIDDGLLQQRAVKSQIELVHIRQALKIQQQAFADMLAFVQPGMTEQQVCAFLEYRMRALGADGVSFPSIIAVDGNAAMCHAIPSKTKLKKQCLMLVDFGAKSNGYCSDLTRTLFFGKPKPKLREVFEVVLEAQRAAIAAIEPGVALKKVDDVARSIITKAGYGEQFGHGLGHGLGLNIHEQPVLAAKSEGVLQEGHVVTVEPGIYLPEVGGVRIEDDILVTSKGYRELSSLPRTLDDMCVG